MRCSAERGDFTPDPVDPGAGAGVGLIASVAELKPWMVDLSFLLSLLAKALTFSVIGAGSATLTATLFSPVTSALAC
jgi:hypothetical protein